MGNDERVIYAFDGEMEISAEVYDGDYLESNDFDGEYGDYMPVSHQDVYKGQTEVTPSPYTQTLLTADKLLKENIIINPIPNNYGLITWDGQKLIVS